MTCFLAGGWDFAGLLAAASPFAGSRIVICEVCLTMISGWPLNSLTLPRMRTFEPVSVFAASPLNALSS